MGTWLYDERRIGPEPADQSKFGARPSAKADGLNFCPDQVTHIAYARNGKNSAPPTERAHFNPGKAASIAASKSEES
jgi:hypothetical protein